MDFIIGLASIAIALWLSIKVLKFLFIASKKAIGWIGPYIIATVPSTMMYIFTTDIFGWGTRNASFTGLITAIIIGTILNSEV